MLHTFLLALISRFMVYKMDKVFNFHSVIIGVFGGLFTFLFGKLDVIFYTLIAFIVLDYITGIIKAFYTKTVSSEIGKKGLLKKVMILIIVAVAVLLHRLIAQLMPELNTPLREIVIVFYICNEGISIMENTAEYLPIPAKLKDTLSQLRERNDANDSE